MLLYQSLAYTIHGKYKKSHIKRMNLKSQLKNEKKPVNYLTDHLLFHIFKIILNIDQTVWGYVCESFSRNTCK